MPCNNSSCAKTVEKNGVRYCICGACCCCHIYGGYAGSICPDGKYWWKKMEPGSKKYREKWVAGQSHGGSHTPCNDGWNHKFPHKKN